MIRVIRQFIASLILSSVILSLGITNAQAVSIINYYVDPISGLDTNGGGSLDPFLTITRALQEIPPVVKDHYTIHLAPGTYSTHGGLDMPGSTLDLNRKTMHRVKVRIVGDCAGIGCVTLDWSHANAFYLISVTHGHWSLENIQLGTRSYGQREGIVVDGGDAFMELIDVLIRVGSFSGAGISAIHGGSVELNGTIGLNDDISCTLGEETFAGIYAGLFGSIRFRDGGGTLDMGNGDLVSYSYGYVQLGAQTVDITSCGSGSAAIFILGSGRVDLHGSPTTVTHKNPGSPSIFMLDDAHVLAEGASLFINVQPNQTAMKVENASTLMGPQVQINGVPGYAVKVSSGSHFIGNFTGDLGRISSTAAGVMMIGDVTGQLPPASEVETSLLGKIRLCKSGSCNVYQ